VAIDVSVVIPFFNPGADIDDCLSSMIAQTMPADRFEVVLVDDGSTDGSSAAVDAWVARYPRLLTVLHLPASGGPAHPRNVGIETARGRYIQFVDSDDSLAPGALARLVDIADESEADIVIGKISSDFRGVYQPLFRTTVTRRTLADFPLMQNLTVCKMFRREFLLAHGIRLPEGPTYIEDQHLCVQAYAHAASVAVVADTVCYLYRRRRDAGLNHGDETIEPAAYYAELATIMDIIDGPAFPAAARAAAYTRYYRTEMLGRLRGRAMTGYDAGYRDALVTEIRRLAERRLPAGVHEGLPVFLRAQSQLVREDRRGELLELAASLQRVGLHATAAAVRWDAGALVIEVEAHLAHDARPLQLRRDASGWLLPADVVPAVGADDRRLGPADDTDLDIDLATTSRADGTVWSTTHGLRLDIDDDGAVVVRGEVRIDPQQVAGGRALEAGLWDLRLRVRFGGLSWGARLQPAVVPRAVVPPAPAGWLGGLAGNAPQHAVETPTVIAFWTDGTPTLALDVGQWMHSLLDLFDDPPGARVVAARTLQIDVPRVTGADASVAARVILVPVSDQSMATVECVAELRSGPQGATIAAVIPALPGGAERWSVWLGLGAVGTAAPRNLSIDLTESRLRRLRVSTAAS
jgi:glycosyltransferase involved in cell wall biosynthesis